jgi:hypothetical protein
MRLSPNFKLSEFTASPTARERGINNEIPADLIPNVQALVDNVVQPLRTSLGRAGRVTSGFRSDALNRAVGGAATSQHRTGEAVDIRFDGITTFEAASRAVELNSPFDQMILYPNFLHLSHTKSRKNRGQVLYHRTYTGERL